MELQTKIKMTRMIDCLSSYNSIAVVGMCKNAGKTTVLNYIIDEYHDIYSLGITSIGYDGEKQDEITKLDKPRIEVYPGMQVATCEACLESATAKYKKICDTGIRTALGEVCIIKIKSQGFVEVSGPSMVSQIEVICSMMGKSGCDKVLVDGAAGRTSFASRMECTILSVGAAMFQDMSKVVALARHQVELFGLEQSEDSYAIKFNNDNPYAVLKTDDNAVFVFRGAMVNDDLTKIMKNYKDYKTIAVVNDASSVFVSPRIYSKFCRASELRVQNRTNLVALTINPMSPYGKWFDKDKFIQKMQEHVEIPVFNVMDEKEKSDGEQIKY